MRQIGDRDVKEKALFRLVLYPLEEREVGVRWAEDRQKAKVA